MTQHTRTREHDDDCDESTTTRRSYMAGLGTGLAAAVSPLTVAWPWSDPGSLSELAATYDAFGGGTATEIAIEHGNARHPSWPVVYEAGKRNSLETWLTESDDRELLAEHQPSRAATVIAPPGDIRSLAANGWIEGVDINFEASYADPVDNLAERVENKTGEDGLTWLHAADSEAWQDANRRLEYRDHYTRTDDEELRFRLKKGSEGAVKSHLYDEGYPPIDERRLDEGASLDLELRDDIELRPYQQDWVEHFAARKSGVFVGPSGSGKTMAAIGAMEAIGGETLILVPNRELAQQWVDELLDKTTLPRRRIGQYHGGEKRIRPVTIATYDTAAMSRHRKLFNEREWGLVVADECHHAVAETWKRFREIQSVARLGLSATPVRESGDAKEIYTLIGPPVGTDWGSLFADGWVSKPEVEIITVPWGTDRERENYEMMNGSRMMIEAAKNSAKTEVIRSLLADHTDAKAIIFVDWIKQGKDLADELGLPFIYGETNHDDREDIYQQFRDGELEALIISRVGDEGIDLPDAEVAILASTMGSSRSQTGQRAGRTMRPFGDSQVYVLLTKGSGEEDWGRESTQYLGEKGIDISKREWGGSDA